MYKIQCATKELYKFNEICMHVQVGYYRSLTFKQMILIDFCEKFGDRAQ